MYKENIPVLFLAAGLGTRLRPITFETPKCMVSINGFTLLSIWDEILKRLGSSYILINTHYLATKVQNYIQNLNSKRKGAVWNTFFEKELLGSAGTTYTTISKQHFKNHKELIIIYADGLTDFDLSEFVKFHRKNNSVFSMGLFHSETPELFGVVELDNKHNIKSFEEKPTKPKSNLVNAGIYMASIDFLKENLKESDFDISKDFIPRILKKIKCFAFSGYHRDIGTLDSLNIARNDALAKKINIINKIKKGN